MTIPTKSYRRVGAAGVFALVGLLSANTGATQYQMIDNFNTTPFTGGDAYGVYHGVVAGDYAKGAAIWSSPSQRIDLNPGPGVSSHFPAGYETSIIFAISGNQEVGRGISNVDSQQHALLWTGTAASVVDLTSGPTAPHIGYATATDGTHQVGVVSGTFGGFAALWSGTPDSFVNLNPSGYSESYATGVYGGIQVGYGNPQGGGGNLGVNALMWRGSAGSFSVLATLAKAMGISRGQVVGLAATSNPKSAQDAAIWNLSNPTTFVDVAPPSTTASELLATNGTQQVGDVSLTTPAEGQLPNDHRAGVWTGTAGSFQMLAVPQGDNYSMAYGIDGDGSIVGVAGIENNGNAGGLVPVEWIPPRFPGDANFDGRVNFSDLTILARDFGKPGEWVDGDFNGDGNVGFDDLVILAANYGKSQGAAASYSVQVQAPEPSSILAFGPGALLLLRRHRR